MTTWMKQGVFGELQAPAAEGLRIVEKVFRDNGWGDVYVTSIREGTHGIGSFHPAGRAFDIRWPPGANVQAVLKILRKALGDDFDVVGESNHIHIEYQP